jgi:hypothetical protein
MCLSAGYGFELSARFNTFGIIVYSYIGTKEQDLGLWSWFEKMMEINDSVTELGRIKAKQARIFSFKIIMWGGRKHMK